jgi:ParB family chromosome partitioning protein
MSKRIEEMMAKSAKLRSVSQVNQDEVTADQPPRIGAVRTAKLELMKYESELPLIDLHEVPGRKRHLTNEQITELKANLANNPLTSPIAVRRRQAGGYEIISGHNRVQVYRDLGRTKIFSVVFEMTDDEAERSAFYSNLLSPALPDFEKFVGLRARIEHGNLTQEQVAKEAGVSQQLVSLLLSFSGLPKAAISILDAHADKGLLGASAAAKLAQIAKKGRGERVVEAVRQLADRKLSQVAAIGYAVSEERIKPQATTSIIIRSGKKIFCSIRRAEKDLRFSFSDLMDENLFNEIQKVIENYAKKCI